MWVKIPIGNTPTAEWKRGVLIRNGYRSGYGVQSVPLAFTRVTLGHNFSHNMDGS